MSRPLSVFIGILAFRLLMLILDHFNFFFYLKEDYMNDSIGLIAQEIVLTVVYVTFFSGILLVLYAFIAWTFKLGPFKCEQ